MEKATQVKPRKDKKKNTETGMLMGTTTNVFSQLAASYLQNKTNITQDQENFLQNTQIIEYHDPNINRLIALLRKKAQVTKVKAVCELREEIAKMNDQNIEELIPTFSHLYLQTILNQPSKQVVDQFIAILTQILTDHKKVAIKEINTLYGPMLLSMKISKTAALLFNGTQEQQLDKSLILLLKKDSRKKFFVMLKIIMESEMLQKIGLSNFQKNCSSLMKVIKDFIKIFEKSSKAAQLQTQFIKFIEQICESLTGKCIDEYFKNGGKAKASILQLYTALLSFYSRYQKLRIDWQYFAKTIGSQFLDKDPIVQQSLWKYSNKVFIQTLLKLGEKSQKKDRQMYINQFFQKSDERLINVLKIGGSTMYKQLSEFIQILPLTSFYEDQTHKSLINKITFVRKWMACIIDQDDENQSRSECYFSLGEHLIFKMRKINLLDLDQKKQKQIGSLISKAQKEIFENIQQFYYKYPPISKNSFSYYLPMPYATLIQKVHPKFQIRFDAISSIQLYKYLKFTEATEKYINFIFENCKEKQKLLLDYLQSFPQRDVQIDMSQANKEIELASKIFLLSIKDSEGEKWFQQNWDLKKQIIVYDPRIIANDFQIEQQDETHALNLYFRPINKNLPSPLYDRPAFDEIRFKFFMKMLQDKEFISEIKYLLPFLNDFIIQRNPIFLNKLLELYECKSLELKNGKWIIGKYQVTFIRIISQVVIQFLTKSKNNKQIDENLLSVFFINYCQFSRIIYNYKMDHQAEQLLKKYNQLMINQDYHKLIFQSAKQSINRSYLQLLKGGNFITENQQKLRKNRLKRCTDFISKVIWYAISRNEVAQYVTLIKELFSNEEGWNQAANRYQPWIIGSSILNKAGDKVFKQVAKELISNIDKYLNIVGLILSCQIILPLQNHPQEKSQFINVQSKIIKLVSNEEQANALSIIQKLVVYAVSQSSYLLSQGIQNLLKQLFKKQIGESKEFVKECFKICFQSTFNRISINENPQSIYQILILTNIIIEFPLKDIQNIEAIFSSVLEKLLAAKNDITYLEIISIASIFWENGIGLAHIQLHSDLLLRKSIESAENVPKQDDLYSNFAIYSELSFVNSIYQHSNRQILKKYDELFMNNLWTAIKQGSPLHCLAQSAKMRYASKILRNSNSQIASKLVSQIPQIALDEYKFYQNLLFKIEDEESQAFLPHSQNITNLFIEISEFTIRIPGVLSSKCKPDQEIILELIQCPFLGLKKSSFILLKQMYELKIVERQPPKIYADLLKFELHVNDELNSLIAGKISTYLYAWQALLLRREAIERVGQDEKDENSITLEDYIGSSGFSQLFLKNCFGILEEKLNFLKNQQTFDINSDQLLISDYTINFEEGQDIQNKIFKMTMRTLFIFIVNFPIFLREFMDKNKKYKNLCDRLLRLVISDAIFKQEVQKIEIKEPQWKASDNFEIFVTPKNKQIYAEYVHDVIRIGLRLVMKGNYPLSPIAIEFGEGLKLQEGSKWALMLQSQLHNRNNTIINGILLWKQNIDKKLAGVEECSICFDIVNGSGQLPKKACKTCKKKFHGNCIMKWFTKSNKSECPLCKSQFL